MNIRRFNRDETAWSRNKMVMMSEKCSLNRLIADQRPQPETTIPHSQAVQQLETVPKIWFFPFNRARKKIQHESWIQNIRISISILLCSLYRFSTVHYSSLSTTYSKRLPKRLVSGNSNPKHFCKAYSISLVRISSGSNSISGSSTLAFSSVWLLLRMRS